MVYHQALRGAARRALMAIPLQCQPSGDLPPNMILAHSTTAPVVAFVSGPLLAHPCAGTGPVASLLVTTTGNLKRNPTHRTRPRFPSRVPPPPQPITRGAAVSGTPTQFRRRAVNSTSTYRANHLRPILGPVKRGFRDTLAVFVGTCVATIDLPGSARAKHHTTVMAGLVSECSLCRRKTRTTTEPPHALTATHKPLPTHFTYCLLVPHTPSVPQPWLYVHYADMARRRLLQEALAL